MKNSTTIRIAMLTLVLSLFLCFNTIKAQDWNLLWSFDVSSLAGGGQYGSETDGEYVYTSNLNSGGFDKFDYDGNWIETFFIVGATNIYDLAYDGEYFYGGKTDYNTPIYIMDFNSQQLINSITLPIDLTASHIAYDSENDAFWCGSFYTDIYLVSRVGTVQDTIPSSLFQVQNLSGSAYDNISPGGPYLWLHSQYYSETPAAIVQINISTGTQTGIWHNVMTDAGLEMGYGYAGGLFNSTDLIPGYLVIGGVLQGSSFRIFAYSMLQYLEESPNLSNPENFSYGNSTIPLFQWGATENAVSYQLQVSSQKNFSINEIDIEGLTDTIYQSIIPLNQISRYYWRVRGQNLEGIYGAWSEKFVFFTEGELPQPILISPEDSSENLTPNVNLSWTSNDAALNYHLQVSATPDFTAIIIDEPLLTNPSSNGTGLLINSEYWWRVKMTNPVNTSQWSETRTFTTGSFIQIGTGNNYNTTSSYPTGYGNYRDGAKQQFLIRAEEIMNAGGTAGAIHSLGFNVAIINSGQALQDYEIKIKNSSLTEFSNEWDLNNYTSVYFTESFQPIEGWNIHQFTEPFYWDGMSNIIVDICFNNIDYSSNESTYWTNYEYPSSMYYRSNNDPTLCSQPLWSSTTTYRPNMQFALELLEIYPPIQSLPTNQSICVSTTPLIEWEETANAINYTLQIALEEDFNTIIFETGTDVSNYQLLADSALNELTRYYWRVNATDGTNISFWSQVWQFVTEGDLPAPILITPADFSLEIGTVQYFSWEPNIFANSYQLQIATDEEFVNIFYDSLLTENSAFIINLPLNSECYWHVKSLNECSEGIFSDTRYFTTSNIPSAYAYNTTWLSNMNPGPIIFPLNEPENLFLLQDQSNLSSLTSGTWINGLWYGISNYDLVSINPSSGERTVIGNIGIEIYEISYDNKNNILYAIAYNQGSYSLYSIDIFTAFPTFIGTISNSNFSGLAISLEGDLYSINLQNNCLYSIDKYTGEATLIGPTGFSATSRQNLEFELSTNTCYWLGRISGEDHILTIDIATGAATDIGTFPNSMSVYALAIPIIPACLDFPELVEPANKSVCIEVYTNFDWNDVTGASSYILQVANDYNFVDVVAEIDSITESNYVLENPLSELTKYFWRIMAVGEDNCNSYWSSRWSFVVDGDLPQPVLFTPLNGIENYYLQPTFTWAGSIGAEYYYLQLATDPDFYNLIIDNPYITETSFQCSITLDFNTQYWWRVKMINSCTESEWSEYWTFITGAFVTIGNDSSFNIQWTYPSPYGNAFGGCKHQILIRAEELNEVGMSPGYITSLSFDVALINANVALQDFYISIKTTEENVLSTNWDLNNWTLVYGPVNYLPIPGWNLHLFDEAFYWDGTSNILLDICFNNMNYTLNESMRYTPTEYNSVRWFSANQNPTVCNNPLWASTSFNRPNMMFGIVTNGLISPQLVEPLNNSMDVSTNPLFLWNEVNSATAYTIQVSTSDDFSYILFEHNITESNSYQVTEDEQLDVLTQYFWRVLASNNEFTSEWSYVFTFITESGLSSQNISLSSGWNIISSYIEPENDTITSIFVNIATDVKIVKNAAGEMYDPAFNINTIGNWNYEDGYLVNMLNDNELTITGTKLHPEETPIILNNGWNLSAYLRDNEMSPTTALSSISSSLVLAKDNVGGIFMPSYGINTIGNMQAGQGYYFYMNAASILTYPANSAQKAVAGDEMTPLAKYNIPTMKNSGKNATLLISIESNDGNEIGVYNMKNELIGAGAIHNGVAAITIWGDDEATQSVDGAKDNEYLNVKLHNATNNTSKEISLTQIKEITGNTEQNELYYKTNAIFVAKAIANDETGFAMSIKNIPNPVESNVVFEFTLTDEANAEIQIYTSTGELVASIANDNYSAGLHRINFDASNLANGMYNIVLSSGERKVTSFMVVNK